MGRRKSKAPTAWKPHAAPSKHPEYSVWFWPIYNAQNRRCAICGAALSAKYATEEHVIPRGRMPAGRDKGLWNRVLAHKKCNGAKGDRIPTQFELDTLAAINIIVEYEQRHGVL